MRTSLLSLSLLSTALLAACSDDIPPPKDVRAHIADDLHNVLSEGKAAMAGSTANLPTGAAFGFATTAVGGVSPRLAAPLSNLLQHAKDRTSNATGDEIDPDAIIQTLNEKLFTDANYLGDGIYKVPPELVCADGDVDCAQHVTDAQLRVRVADDDGLRFWIQIDANHDEPLSFLLRHDELAITLNLDDATDAMIALAQLEGQQAPNADLAGQITGDLKILGHAHASASITFDRAIDIKFADQGTSLTSDGAFRVTSAKANVVAIDLDGNAPKANLDLGLGETTAHIPGDEFDPASRDFDLGGATVNATFQANTLTLANLSLGQKTTTVKVGGQQAVAIDLNANDGRKLTATVTADPATGSETLAVSPRLDLQASIDHALLGDDQPVYDITRVLLDGSLRGSSTSDQVEVVSGSFSIQTNPAQYGFAASAGQCVTSTEIYDDTTFTSYTQYSVGACQ